MLHIIPASLAVIAMAAGTPAEITNSRVMADYSVHISGNRLGDAIYIGPCRSTDHSDTVYIRFVDSAVEADISGYLTDNEERADWTFCTD